VPQFPFEGKTLSDMDVPIGPMVSEILNKLKETWKNECNFNMNTNTVEMLLVRANEMNKNNVININT